MAIDKSNFKVSRFDSELSHGSGETMSTDEEEILQHRIPTVESDHNVDDELDDVDSGAGSDDFDLLELAEAGAEFCKVGNVTCSIPFELYDLPGLQDILSVDVWNECLTEEERLNLVKCLPDMDQHMFMLTLKELFEGSNFHFGSPIKKLFEMLKSGQCEPRNALYLEGRNFFQRTKHCHQLRKYHNDMVVNLCQIRDAWMNCKGYCMNEKLRVLNIMKSQKNFMYEKMEDFGANSSDRDDSFDGLWSRKVKDSKSARNKFGRLSPYGVDSNFELSSQGQPMAMESVKYGKQKSKGMLKIASSKNRFAKDVNSGSFGTTSPLRRQKYDSGAVLGLRNRIRTDNNLEDPLFSMGSRRERDFIHGGIMERSGLSRLGKKHDFLRDEELARDRFKGLPYPSKHRNTRSPNDFVRMGKHIESIHPRTSANQKKNPKRSSLQLPMKGSLAELSDRAELYYHGKTQGDTFSVDPSYISDDWNGRRKKWKAERESPDISFKSYRASPQQMNERFLNTEYQADLLQEKIRVSVASNGGPDKAGFKGSTVFVRSEDTESDSSEQYHDDEDRNRLMWSKLAYSGGGMDSCRASLLKSGGDTRKTKFGKKDTQENEWPLDGISVYSKNVGSMSEHVYVAGAENYLSRAKLKSKMHDSNPLDNFAGRDFEDSSTSGLGRCKEEDDRRQTYRPGKNRRLLQRQTGDTLPRSLRKREGFDEDDDSLEMRSLVNDSSGGRLGRKGLLIESHVNDGSEKLEVGLLDCVTVKKKKKAKESFLEMERRSENGSLPFDHQKSIDDSTSSKKKGKKKLEAGAGSPVLVLSETHKAEMGATDVEMEIKPQKKPFTLITPTVHTGFSFSIIHLLSAVRMAMLNARPEDSPGFGKAGEKQNGGHEGGEIGVTISEDADTNKSHPPPSLTVPEIVSCVRSNPGDPCILETQEPLQDLVRGVLKIFSSKTSPLGAKGWKTLVAYEKSTKSWSWIGPVPQSLTDHETAEEVTSPEAWGLPHKMLVKLVDAFASWLKNGQETLQQIGSLPEPPLSMMQCNLDEKERFKDLRAQKSLNTITPSSEEVKAYFRKEEVLRYSIPDRAFAYTAADGRKSIVAPLRRGGGKPTSKARDHFMLKRDRPPHVTILCLVRDAAARLPGSIGTRADVCTLIRDSQYIVEDVTDAQVNQVVSGALDRLHYERDPCVQFDGERKLWVYLHRDREEEDFEDDGTSSTKKWKRPKKDAAERPDQGAVTVAFHGNGDQSGIDLGSDLNAEPACIEEDKGRENLCNDARQNAEDNVDDDTHEDHSMVWDAGPNSVQENKFLCQENSVNDDFGDET